MENLHYYDYCTPEFDESLKIIKGLTWLPWVGNNYQNTKCRTLVIGESHYHTNDIKLRESFTDILLTRSLIYDYAIYLDWECVNPTIDNFTRALFNDNYLTFFHDSTENLEKRKSLWSHLAFYNFVQRPMLYNSEKKERPVSEDFYNGWSVFIEVIKVLRPTDCIFIGTKASDFFEYMMSTMNIQHSVVSKINTNSNTYGRSFSLAIDSKPIKMLSIKNTSKYFSYSKWHYFLREQNSEMLDYLNEIVRKEDETVNPK